MKLSRVFLSLTMVMACAAAAPEKPWSVTVKTSGGIAGRGIGAWTIASDGNVTMRRMNGEECTFALTEEELRTVAVFLEAATRAAEDRSAAG